MNSSFKNANNTGAHQLHMHQRHISTLAVHCLHVGSSKPLLSTTIEFHAEQAGIISEHLPTHENLSLGFPTRLTQLDSCCVECQIGHNFWLLVALFAHQ